MVKEFSNSSRTRKIKKDDHLRLGGDEERCDSDELERRLLNVADAREEPVSVLQRQVERLTVDLVNFTHLKAGFTLNKNSNLHKSL